MDSFSLRRPSISTLSSSKHEPLIVVEESDIYGDEELQNSQKSQIYKTGSDIYSTMNSYLLSPWHDPREVRKHSLPSQQVSEGITASQVRRLSERGGESSGPSPKEAAFLATLSQAPAPSGRRHSVVTISKVPTALFGRNRRESVAAFPIGCRVLQSRKESGAFVRPPSTDHLGSIHNLQLDVMDDIVQTRKARIKLWTTDNKKVCEVQTVNEGSGNTSIQCYTNRRHSDFVGAGLSPVPSPRRASEQPGITSPTLSVSGLRKKSKTSSLGDHSELELYLGLLTSSAMEIHKCDAQSQYAPNKAKSNSFSVLTLDPNKERSTRSNSFDVSLLVTAKQLISDTEDKTSTALSGWFKKRHLPIAKKRTTRRKSPTMALSNDMLDKLRNKTEGKEIKKQSKPRNKLDSKSSITNAHSIGNAIEGLIRKNKMSSTKGAVPKSSNKKLSGVRSSLNWFARSEEDDSKDACDSSLCSTLKDLFVK